MKDIPIPPFDSDAATQTPAITEDPEDGATDPDTGSPDTATATTPDPGISREELRDIVAPLESQINEMAAIIATLQETAEPLMDQVGEMCERTATTDATVAAQAERVEMRNQQIETLTQEIKENRAEIEEARALRGLYERADAALSLLVDGDLIQVRSHEPDVRNRVIDTLNRWYKEARRTKSYVSYVGPSSSVIVRVRVT